DALIKKENQFEIQLFLNELSDRDSFIIKSRIGYNAEKPLSLSEIGKILGLSKSAIREIENKIKLKALRWKGGILNETYKAA
ncbi:MAG: RNA polymerase sigma factor RpoD/SigA, partial [Treponema sp.]|nr:RNA polymerase sigma factor RpoD/SigA [Treponema sp.]